MDSGSSTRIERENYFQHQFSAIDIDVTLQILDLIKVKDILSIRQVSDQIFGLYLIVDP